MLILGQTHTVIRHAHILANEISKEHGKPEIGYHTVAQWVSRGDVASLDWYGVAMIDIPSLRRKVESYEPKKPRGWKVAQSKSMESNGD